MNVGRPIKHLFEVCRGVSWRAAGGVAGRDRPAREADIHALALAMPHVTVDARSGLPVYQVGARSFVFFRTPRPDAVDADGRRLTDVVVFWVPDEQDKAALLGEPDSPWFSTAHFDGHPSVLLQTSRVAELPLSRLTEVVQDAWLSRASVRRAATWLAAHPTR